MIEVIKGDITKANEDIIVQQVNCQAKMGSGLAANIMKRYPTIRKEYIQFCHENRKKEEGADVLLGKVHYFDAYDGKVIANVFGQEEIRKSNYDKKIYTKTEALLNGIKQVKDKAEQLGLTVALPVNIGCGKANGNWGEIKPKIEEIFEDGKVHAVFYHYEG